MEVLRAVIGIVGFSAAHAYAGVCFANVVVQPDYSHKWIHINVPCNTRMDCTNVCDCDAACINTQVGCNATLPPGCRSMANASCFDTVCPYLHNNGTNCGICPLGTAAAGACSSDCAKPAQS